MNNTAEKLKKFNLILASKSPRRQLLMRGLDLDFQIKVKRIKEDYPAEMPYTEIPEYLAAKKAKSFNLNDFPEKTIIITADTIVVLDGQVIGKPNDKAHAKEILGRLSGKKHLVITGVFLTSSDKASSFSVTSEVSFKELTSEEIEYYVENYNPMDKAGAYGIQEWIGYIAIDRIDGSFYNVMGLPTQKLYSELLKFIS